MKTQTLIEQLGLEPLPGGEGGFFKRVHSFMKEDRLLGSVIYYLITEESYSSLHYLSTDEVWFFLEGDPLDQLVLNSDGSHELRRLGPVSQAKQPLSVVRGGGVGRELNSREPMVGLYVPLPWFLLMIRVFTCKVLWSWRASIHSVLI